MTSRRAWVAAAVAAAGVLVATAATAATRAVTTAPGAATAAPSPANARGLSRTVDVPAPGAGAAPLGTTAYAVPANAHFVAPTGNDAAKGSQAKPWRTLHHAVAAAPSGSTIVLRAGIYREGATISSKRLTLQPYPHEAVVVRGTQIVTGFVAAGKTWVLSGWNHQFARQGPAQLIKAAAPLANAPDMVFVDGKQLRQLANPTRVRAGTFAVDYTHKKLTIGIDPKGHTIEAATVQVGLSLVHADGSIVRGIQFDEFATPYNPHGAVRDVSKNVTFENDIFTQNAMAGITEQGTNAVITHCTISANGQLGVHAYKATNTTLYANRITANNNARFNQQQEAGGVKASRSTGFDVDSNLIDHNIGTGVWFDLGSNKTTIVHNDFFANRAQGAEYEISSNATIAGNISRANSGGGIRIIESQHVQVWNNDAFRNDTPIEVWNGPRTQNPSDIKISNNIMMDGHAVTKVLLDVDDKTHKLSAAQMGVTADHDAYCRSTPAAPKNVVSWARGGGQAIYAQLPPFAAATHNEVHGIACDGSAAGTMFLDTKRNDFTLGGVSPGRRAGAPLPAAIAAVLGAPSGVPVDLGAI